MRLLCRDCACWEPYTTQDEGICLRYPPTVVVLPHSYESATTYIASNVATYYPETEDDDSCWDGIAKEQE